MFSICVLGSIWSLKPSDFCPLEAESFKVFSTFSTRSPRRRPRDRSFIVIDNIWAVLVGDRVFLVDRRFVVGGFLSSRDCWMVFSCWVCFVGKFWQYPNTGETKSMCDFFLRWGVVGLAQTYWDVKGSNLSGLKQTRFLVEIQRGIRWTFASGWPFWNQWFTFIMVR